VASLSLSTCSLGPLMFNLLALGRGCDRRHDIRSLPSLGERHNAVDLLSFTQRGRRAGAAQSKCSLPPPPHPHHARNHITAPADYLLLTEISLLNHSCQQHHHRHRQRRQQRGANRSPTAAAAVGHARRLAVQLRSHDYENDHVLFIAALIAVFIRIIIFSTYCWQ